MASVVARKLDRARRLLNRVLRRGGGSQSIKIPAPAIQRTKPMNAIIHIGEPKSGSTTIQSFLFQNSDALAKQGFKYKRIFEHVTSQIELPLEALRRSGHLPPNESSRRRYQATSLEQLEKNVHHRIRVLRSYPTRWAESTAVFSSEQISAWIDTPELVREFDSMMSETFAERRYILYLRDPVSRLISGYSERMKRGQSVTFEQYLDKVANLKPQSENAKAWTDTLGRDRLNIRLMDPGFLRDKDLIDDFAAICGIDMVGLKRPKRANESLSALGVHVLRALNRRIPMLTKDGKRNPLRKGLVAAVMERTAESPPFEPSIEHIRALEHIVRESNDTLHREFFPDRDELFQKRQKREPLDFQSLNQEAFDVLTEIIADLRLGKIASLEKHERIEALVREPDGYFEE